MLVEMAIGASMMENSVEFLKKLEIKLPFTSFIHHDIFRAFFLFSFAEC